jgi:hypothetical protein
MTKTVLVPGSGIDALSPDQQSCRLRNPMSTQSAERHLPADVLARASLRGNEYAWSINDIPLVIDAARQENLVSIGGQLQFRLPDGGVCECYWVEIDTYRAVPKSLPWTDRVERSAAVAMKDFDDLRSRVDFMVEGRKAFAAHLDALIAGGLDPTDSICFVWYVLDQDEAAEKQL